MDVYELNQREEVRAMREINELLGGGGDFREAFMEEVAFEQEFLLGFRGGESGTLGNSNHGQEHGWALGDTGPAGAGQKGG